MYIYILAQSVGAVEHTNIFTEVRPPPTCVFNITLNLIVKLQ